MADDRATCRVCGQSFMVGIAPPPSSCGRAYCRAMTEWPAARWDGQARMADARMVAGVPLDELDREALRRCATAPLADAGSAVTA